jgi:predicted Zn-dependent protease with MMP-like domain
MKPDAFDRVVQEVLKELPKDLRGALETVQIVVKEAPTEVELGRAGL